MQPTGEKSDSPLIQARNMAPTIDGYSLMRVWVCVYAHTYVPQALQHYGFVC